MRRLRMEKPIYRLYARGVTALSLCAVAGYALLQAGPALTELIAVRGEFLMLLVPAMLAARIVTRQTGECAPRGALVFVLAGIALLPIPAGLALAAAASMAGMGRGVAGGYRGGMIGLAALTIAVALAEQCMLVLPVGLDTQSPQFLLPLTLLFIVIQGFALAVGLALALGAGSTAGALSSGSRTWSNAGLELANVPLAWFLAMLLAQQAWLPAAGFSTMVLITLSVLKRLEHERGRLERTHESLNSRVAELAVLHDVGRDILASLDPERVYRLIDRESRKFLDVHACSVALADVDSNRLRRVYTRNEMGVQIGETRVTSGLAARVLHQKRPLFVGDVQGLPRNGSLRANLLHPDSRSVMGVPLIVEERVVGVLTVESPRAQAYDDHQLAVLTTIGQQVAAAIEGVRHCHMARVDGLTGFFVKDYFFRRLDEEDRRARRYGGKFAILMIDLDSFKDVNDTHGHLAGDRFLREITITIREQLRGNDLACRYGGDEFCLMLPESDLEAAWATGERIRAAVSRRIITIGDAALRTTVSVGVAAYPDHGSSVSSILDAADAALYRAKEAGRNRVGVPSS
jgi:diguanylate cyclase (GGDEF)-like protein